MGNFVPPAQTEDPLQTADVEGLKGFGVTSVQDPGFATVQKGRYTDGIVDGNFGGWDRRTDRRTDGFTIASTALSTASYADTL